MGVRLLLISTKVTKKQPESWTPVEQEYLLFIQVLFYKFTQPGEPVTFSAIFLGLLVSITGLSVEKAAAFSKL